MDIVLLTDLHAECRIFVFSVVVFFSFFVNFHLFRSFVINFGALSMILSMFSGVQQQI